MILIFRKMIKFNKLKLKKIDQLQFPNTSYFCENHNQVLAKSKKILLKKFLLYKSWTFINMDLQLEKMKLNQDKTVKL
jgi:hypothetical protein